MTNPRIPSVSIHPVHGRNGVLGNIWTPAAMTLFRWYDFSDASTITLNGSTISQINDKSGNAQNATQGVSANQPNGTSDNLIGLGVAAFDNVDDFLQFNDGASAGWSLFSVFKMGTATPQRLLASGTGTSRIPYIEQGSAATDVVNVLGVANVGALTYRKNGAALSLPTRGDAYNALAVNSWLSFSIVGIDAGAAALRLGGAGVQNLSGSVAQLVIKNGAFTTNEVERLEGWAHHKYGLAGLLPGGHPYKASAPVV